MPNPLVSIIIPVYRAEATLPACLEQLKAQTYRSLQLIFIDDASPDGSYAYLLAQRPELESLGMEVTLLQHPTNQGVAVARNTGLDAVHGTYIYSVDADDKLHPEAIERMVALAERQQADLVGIEYTLEEGASHRTITQPEVTTGLEAFRQIALGTMKWNLWLFLFRRELLEQADRLRFLPGENMGEDLMLLSRLLHRSGRIAMLHEPLYTYVRSDAQLTGAYRPEHWAQVQANVAELERTLPGSSEVLLNFLKLTLKRPLLVSGRREDYERWLTTYPEATAAMGHNPALSGRMRLLEQMASRKHYWFVWLYYQLVMRFLYTLLYR